MTNRNNQKSTINIVECTLRDGSYAVDFQFTAKDTAIIATALESAGIRSIEIGHGLGMNASAMGKGSAAATDEEYMRAVAGVLKRAQWGMFFIPGIGRLQDLELAADYKMNFVRIGTNATEVHNSKEYIEYAKKLGLHVSANLMKSYVLPPDELAANALLSQKYGADIVCLVDSAGYMLPDGVRDYFNILRDAINIPIGFHCHDNLALGMANVLVAIDCGVESIDSTLQGIGRGGGNPITEILIAILKRRGIDIGVDLNRLMDISDNLIKPLLKDKGRDAIDITSGYAGFHSGFLKTILTYSDEYGVDPRDLIIEVCNTDQVYAHEDMVERYAKRLKLRKTGCSGMHYVDLQKLSYSNENIKYGEESLISAAQKIAKQVRSAAVKNGKRSVFNIVAARSEYGKATVSRFIQEEFGCVIGSVEIDNGKQLRDVVSAVDGTVDTLMVDAEIKPYQKESLVSIARSCANKSRVFGYRDSDVWIRSIEQCIEAMLKGLYGRKVAVIGSDNHALKMSFVLLERGAKVCIMLPNETAPYKYEDILKLFGGYKGNVHVINYQEEDFIGTEVVVQFEKSDHGINQTMIEKMSDVEVIFDAGIGCLSAEAITYANARGIKVVRPDMRAALAAEIQSVAGAHRVVGELMGRREINGVKVVGGGLIGSRGELIVDSVSNPSKVVGVSDGHGKVIYERQEEYIDNIEKVESEIYKKLCGIN